MHPDRALEMIRGVEPRRQVEEVPLERALGRVLAEPVASPIDSPPFAKAAMDGYAVRSADATDTYRLLGTVAAGDRPVLAVGPGECVQIMTGAMMPAGADQVIQVEFTERTGTDGRTIRRVRPETGRNVIERGENLRRGQTVLEPRVLAPQDIGALAASGIGRVPVAVAPRVAVLSTGSELRPPGEPLGPGQVYDSNGPQLVAQAGRLACPARTLGIVADRPAALSAAVRDGLASCDVLLLSGGVSMGEFDHVPRVLADAGVEVLFHGLEMKPGKPTLFGRTERGYVFGLPGNPVTAFVVFEVLVRPLLYRWMGLEERPPAFRVRLAQAVRRRQADRVEYLPVRLAGGEAHPLPYHGSAHLNALSEANGLIRLEQGVAALEAGEEIDARPI
jgi:molybdopterin molybdotransferase